MGSSSRVAGNVFAGRETETSEVRRFLEDAVNGTAGLLLVTGEAGVGKTALVEHACAEFADQMTVLAGGCLPLMNMSVPFLPLRSALRTRGAGRPGALATPTFEIGQSTDGVPVLLDAWLDAQCEDHPVVLFVDDLQWADQSTLDVIMYLVAGPRTRRLALVATIRHGEAGEGHPLHRWLADMRRMPGTQDLLLDPLDRHATALQLSGILGQPPHESLVEDVFSHARGNAYLTRLLATGLRPDSRHIASGLPSDLAGAVLRSWTRLSPPARQLCRVVAIGGAPISAVRLSRLTGAGQSGDGVPEMLHEAVEAGVLELMPDGRYWFHHPMIAEALHESSPGDERQMWHAAFADDLEQELIFSGHCPVETIVAIADHRHAAGQMDQAFDCALKAADATRAAGGGAEMLRLLTRALALRSGVSSGVPSRQELLVRLVSAAEITGADGEELKAIEALLDEVSPVDKPLEVAGLLMRRSWLRLRTGVSFHSVDEAREVVNLTEALPESAQYACALASLALAEYWNDDPRGRDHATESLKIASGIRDPRALSYTLYINGWAALFDGNNDRCVALAAQSAEMAREAKDPMTLVGAAVVEAQAVNAVTTRGFAESIRKRRIQMAEMKAAHPYIAILAGWEASAWIGIGEWQEGLRCLRVALGANPGPMADVQARLTAAKLAVLQGRAREARGHLDRAEEIFQESAAYRSFEFDVVRAEVCLAEGRPADAYDAALSGLESSGVSPNLCEWLLPLASRALADLSEHARDQGLNPMPHSDAVDSLVARFPDIVRDSGEPTDTAKRQIEALAALYSAEVARAHRSPDAASLWNTAAALLNAATLPWEEAYCYQRCAEALLIDGSGRRAEAAVAVRAGLSLARSLGADPVIDALNVLVDAAHIPVEEVQPEMRFADDPIRAVLTDRERVVLSHLVAGRTYGEIARELFISEKTVSSHVSNLLRKTGTRNRIALARLVKNQDGPHSGQERTEVTTPSTHL
ncbi:LuxR family transcriptional regulator [Homoserinimonas sp. OAct 916]|uniref:helix-turn-helix transcriptional regulator n=1 Tax=Homoserinimonas sp. OAct 916 TaxID=2211450 RepID=UPI000DBE6FB4|nr:LuxR family transcriptional regulator [Homoserinimonas sp. OAct 916]